MGWRINELIERELIDDNCPEPIYSENIEFTGSSITDMLFLKQGGEVISLTYQQLYELHRILKENQYLLWRED